MIAVTPRATFAGLLVASLAWSAGAQAQTTVTRSQSAPSGKAIRLVIAANLKQDCSTGPMPELRIATAPKNGQLVTRSGKLKTPASFRCPNKEAEAQGVFYQSKPGFTGSDEVVVEIKTSDGTVQRQDIRITVETAKKDDKKDDAKDSTKGSGISDL